MQARQNLSKDNYFYARTAEQLGRDFLFFTVLSEIGAGDTHGANFIDKEHGLLHFIDAECFDDTRYTNSADALFLIETAYIAHGWDKPDLSSFMETIKLLVAEFNELKKNQPMRYVPLDTQNFYDMRDQFIACGATEVASLIGGLRKALADPNAERQFQIIGENEDEFNFDETVLERQLTMCFRDFDIPIFVIHGDTISMNGVPVAKETTTIKKEDG